MNTFVPYPLPRKEKQHMRVKVSYHVVQTICEAILPYVKKVQREDMDKAISRLNPKKGIWKRRLKTRDELEYEVLTNWLYHKPHWRSEAKAQEFLDALKVHDLRNGHRVSMSSEDAQWLQSWINILKINVLI